MRTEPVDIVVEISGPPDAVKAGTNWRLLVRTSKTELPAIHPTADSVCS